MTDVTNPIADPYLVTTMTIDWRDIILLLSFAGIAFMVYKSYYSEDEDDEIVDEEPTIGEY
jgi:hypothetical protein